MKPLAMLRAHWLQPVGSWQASAAGTNVLSGNGDPPFVPAQEELTPEIDFTRRLKTLLLRWRAYISLLQDYPCRLQMTQFG
jgi:hypothetical protein